MVGGTASFGNFIQAFAFWVIDKQSITASYVQVSRTVQRNSIMFSDLNYPPIQIDFKLIKLMVVLNCSIHAARWMVLGVKSSVKSNVATLFLQPHKYYFRTSFIIMASEQLALKFSVQLFSAHMEMEHCKKKSKMAKSYYYNDHNNSAYPQYVFALLLWPFC